jgi:hypothetical protein
LADLYSKTENKEKVKILYEKTDSIKKTIDEKNV